MNYKKVLLNKIIGYFGYVISKKDNFLYPPEASDYDKTIFDLVAPYTMTSPERIWSLIQAVKYTLHNKISGDYVECGVWRGGSSMVMALKSLDLDKNNKNIWLYDTFEGMTEPTIFDSEASSGKSASDLLMQTQKKLGNNIWCIASKEDVSNNIERTNYPADKINIIKGNVQSTLISTVPDKISLLRLDTDWYESTKVELEVLFPKLVSGGVCIIDDYGHWEGAKKAVDEYLEKNNIYPLFNRIDNTGRIFIKP